mgnify:CR=1 FL=1
MSGFDHAAPETFVAPIEHGVLSFRDGALRFAKIDMKPAVRFPRHFYFLVGLAVAEFCSALEFLFFGRKGDLSSSCACISIEETKYVDCLKHCDVLWKVMSIIISEPEQVPFFIFKRFGLRKINQCFLRDINRLNEYFEPSHYHVFRIQGEDNIKEKVMQIRDSLEIAGYNANLIRTLVRGELRGEEAYQVNYDADMYLIDSQSIKELMENKEKIMQMNDWLFELYKDAVTETFLNQLIDGSFDKDMIIGVEANGEDTV